MHVPLNTPKLMTVKTSAALARENPKLTVHDRKSVSSWFPYYAGFSHRFARQILSEAILSDKSRILDPWNGVGTTTYVAATLGLDALGIDLNPAMVIVAKARLIPTAEQNSLLPLCREILRKARSDRHNSSGDPLDPWLVQRSAVAASVSADEVVVDASLALKWVEEEPYSIEAWALPQDWRHRRVRMLAPALFAYEATNAIAKRVNVIS